MACVKSRLLKNCTFVFLGLVEQNSTSFIKINTSRRRKKYQMKQTESTLSTILKFAGQCKHYMVISVIFAVAGSACGIVPYIAASQIIIDIYNHTYNIAHISFWAIIALCGYLGYTWLSTLSTILSHQSAFTILKNIRAEITAKLSRMPMGYIVSMPSGKFKTLIMDTVEKLELPIAHLIPELTANTLIPLLMIVYLFVLDWRIALISLITIPIGLLCYMGMMTDYESRYKQVLNAEKNMNASIVEFIGGIEVIKAFNQSSTSYEKYAYAVNENQNAKSTWFKQTNGYYVAGISIMPACLLGVLPLGSYLFINGDISAPTLITCIILALGLVKPLIQALQYTDSLAMVDSTVKEITTLLQANELNRPQDPIKINDTSILFKNVCFAYENKEVIHNLSFKIEPNTLTAIVGPSGSGKSTIARLIMSFWNVKNGEIFVGGVNLNSLPLVQLNEIVSYVSQDNYLFRMTIKENIRLGNPKATDEDVKNAAKLSSCHEFIESLPKGYDTVVGDDGSNLSGGERQRITIARAFLKNTPIILLDEATAFNDPENESVIQASLNSLIQNKTVIVIAHRLSTITNADQIIVMNKGCIEASGKHDQLLHHCQLYHDLWTAHISAKDIQEEARHDQSN